MRTYQWGDLIIDVRDGSQGELRVDWRGKSNQMQPEKDLRPLFAELMLQLKGGRRLELHFEALEFFNSSTIGAVVEYVQELRKRRVPVTMVYDPRRRWQKAFFDALWVFDKGDGMFSVVAR